jgi:hypothetical protein
MAPRGLSANEKRVKSEYPTAAERVVLDWLVCATFLLVAIRRSSLTASVLLLDILRLRALDVRALLFVRTEDSRTDHSSTSVPQSALISTYPTSFLPLTSSFSPHRNGTQP